MEEDWFYAQDGAAVGPMDLAALTAFLSRHPNPKDVYVWRPDFQDWRTAGQVPELNRLTLRPPPLPSQSASPGQESDLLNQVVAPSSQESDLLKQVDDFFREVLNSGTGSAQTFQAKWNALCLSLQSQISYLPKPEQDRLLLQVANRNAEYIAIAQSNREALRIRLGLSPSAVPTTSSGRGGCLISGLFTVGFGEFLLALIGFLMGP